MEKGMVWYGDAYFRGKMPCIFEDIFLEIWPEEWPEDGLRMA